jgi:hypothetical protein
VIRMSRFGTRGLSTKARLRTSWVWYAGCMSLSGCLYIEPTWRGENMPPIIISPQDNPAEHPADVPVLSAIAEDPDVDRFRCFWRVRGSDMPGDTCDQEPGQPLIYTTLYLEGLEDLLGEEIELTIRDFDSSESAVVSFMIVEPVGGFE